MLVLHRTPCVTRCWETRKRHPSEIPTVALMLVRATLTANHEEESHTYRKKNHLDQQTIPRARNLPPVFQVYQTQQLDHRLNTSPGNLKMKMGLPLYFMLVQAKLELVPFSAPSQELHFFKRVDMCTLELFYKMILSTNRS